MWRLFALSFVFIFSNIAFAQQQQSAAAGSNSFNPDISMNVLMLYQNSNRGNDPNVEDRNGASIQEAELQLASDVDPYWRLLGTFSIHQDFDASSLTATPPTAPTRDYVIEPEEAYAESLNLPVVTLKVGKFKTAFGKHNQLHTHAFAFIDAPLINSKLLGDEGLNDVGVSVAALMPASWFSEITLQAVSGHGEGIDYFNGPSANDLATILRLKNLWDLSEDLTMELGTSGATGQNASNSSTNLYGGDLTFKWRPNGRKDRALIWSTEGMRRDFDQTLARERDRGIASWVQYQFALRWWAQLRGEYLQMRQQNPAVAQPENQRKQSFLIGYVPTEFSAIRVQYDHLNDGARKGENKVMVQLNYSIGAHPAHAY